MSKIKDIYCREIFSPQGSPAIETTIVLKDGSAGVSSVAGNEFDSKYSAMNLLDREQNHVLGRGTLKAVEKIQNIIAPELIGQDALKQHDIDVFLFELDGSQNKSRFGANATLGISVAVARAAAKSAGMPLYLYLREFINHNNLTLDTPKLIFTLLNGGRTTENMLDFKDYFVIPASYKTFDESLQIGSLLHSKLQSALQHKHFLPLFTIDGGNAVSLQNNDEAFTFLTHVIETSNIQLGHDVFLGIDANASNFYHNEKYHIKDTSMPLASEDLISYYSDFIEKHHVIYIEDPLTEDDWDGWEKISRTINSDTIIAGDLLTATNPARLQLALNKKAISGIVIKPIQIGTIIEALVVTEIARLSGLKIIVSRWNINTMDDFLADFAVAISADYVNFGPFTRAEYMLNYNRLLAIDKQIKQT